MKLPACEITELVNHVSDSQVANSNADRLIVSKCLWTAQGSSQIATGRRMSLVKPKSDVASSKVGKESLDHFREALGFPELASGNVQRSY